MSDRFTLLSKLGRGASALATARIGQPAVRPTDNLMVITSPHPRPFRG